MHTNLESREQKLIEAWIAHLVLSGETDLTDWIDRELLLRQRRVVEGLTGLPREFLAHICAEVLHGS